MHNFFNHEFFLNLYFLTSNTKTRTSIKGIKTVIIKKERKNPKYQTMKNMCKQIFMVQLYIRRAHDAMTLFINQKRARITVKVWVRVQIRVYTFYNQKRARITVAV